MCFVFLDDTSRLLNLKNIIFFILVRFYYSFSNFYLLNECRNVFQQGFSVHLFAVFVCLFLSFKFFFLYFFCLFFGGSSKVNPKTLRF